MATTTPQTHTPSQSHSQDQLTSSYSYHSSRPSTSSLPRSYKRPKNTPSPQSPVSQGLSPSSGQAGPSRPRMTRPPIARRLVEASPQQWKEGRRREMSVPLLSHELSHFSLSHSSPPDMVTKSNDSSTPPLSHQLFADPTSRPIGTPRSRSRFGSTRTPSAAALPKDHTYPSTAPLPQLPPFLGSPFSSRTARGGYNYCNDSPSHQATQGSMSASLSSGRGQFDQTGSEWLESNDGLPRSHRAAALHDGLSGIPDGLPLPPPRMRRGTNGSNSSMDELSGSGASTASLLSLARSSTEYHSRPNIITSWDEEPQFVEEEEDTATPSRQLFPKPATEHVQHLSKKTGRANEPHPSVHTSKAVPQTTMPRSQNSQLLQSFMNKTPSMDETRAPDVGSSTKFSRSPLATLLPRLLTSKKKAPSMREQVIRRVSSTLEVAEDDDMLTDTEDTASTSPKSTLRAKSSNIWERAKLITSRNPLEGGDFESSRGKGIGLGIQRGPNKSVSRNGAGRSIDLARSLSSDSSGDIDISPSRPLSNKGSTSMFVKPSLPFSPASSAQIDDISKSAFHIRRKSITVPTSLHKAQTGGPTSPTVGAIRPPTMKGRPLLRRGITAPAHTQPHAQTPNNSAFLSAESAFHTPSAGLFDGIRPSPAAFASTGLVKKKSGIQGVEIPKFGVRVDSEPIGESKRDWAARQHGMSRQIEPPSPISPIKPLKLTRPVLNTSLTSISTGSTSKTTSGGGSVSTSTVNSNAAYIQHAQKTRGLRRKGSQMFTVSGSIGSIDMMRSDSNRSARGGTSPATPTKPGLQLTPVGLGITTPSPTSHHVMYPFTTSTSILSTPPHGAHTADSFEPSSMERYRGLPARVRQISNSYQAGNRGPIARASNPMLAASYKASIHVVPETPGQGQVASTATSGLFGLDHNVQSKRNGYNKRVAATRLDKDFTVIQTLGSGAFSQVHKVAEKATGRLFAVKAGKPYTGAKNRLRQLEEVSILRQLSLSPHPNIIEYVDSWETHSRLYIRTTLAECGDLSKFLGLLGDYGGLGEARVWKTLVELADGVSHIHKHNFLHLDLKPSNILINRDGGLVIADLGMAVICSSDSVGRILGGFSPALPEKDDQGGFVWTTSTSSTEATTPGANEGAGQAESTRMEMIPSPILDREIEGDREYLCPEALSGEQIGKGADMFSLGMVVLESAMNVVLPSNGDGWIKLRHDDFSDLNEHYRPRTNSATAPLSSASVNVCQEHETENDSDYDPSVPIISDDLLDVMKGMMRSESARRWTLEDVYEHRVVRNVKRSMRGRALVEEDAQWLEGVLAE